MKLAGDDGAGQTPSARERIAASETMSETESDEEEFIPVGKNVVTTSKLPVKEKTWLDVEEEIEKEKAAAAAAAAKKAVEVVEIEDSEEEEGVNDNAALSRHKPTREEVEFEAAKNRRLLDQHKRAVDKEDDEDLIYPPFSPTQQQQQRSGGTVTYSKIAPVQQQQQRPRQQASRTPPQNLADVFDMSAPERRNEYKMEFRTTPAASAQASPEETSNFLQSLRELQSRGHGTKQQQESALPPKKRNKLQSAKQQQRLAQAKTPLAASAAAASATLDLTRDDSFGCAPNHYHTQRMTLRSDSKYFDARNQDSAAAAEEKRDPGRVLCCFEGEFGPVPLTLGDLATCRDNAVFLNDTLIDFYLRNLVSSFPHDLTKQVHVFTSFLYSKMAQAARANKSWASCYGEVMRWTSGVNLFEKTLVFIPVNQSVHWSLAVVLFTGVGEGAILTLDSFNETSSHKPEEVAHVIRMYLNYEYDHRIVQGNVVERRSSSNINTLPARGGEAAEEEEDEVEFVRQSEARPSAGNERELEEHDLVFTKETMRLHRVKVPSQSDGVNCGLHVLNNARLCLDLLPPHQPDDDEGGRAALDFINLVEERMRRTTFTTGDANALRVKLRDRIKEIKEQEDRLREIQQCNQ